MSLLVWDADLQEMIRTAPVIYDQLFSTFVECQVKSLEMAEYADQNPEIVQVFSSCELIVGAEGDSGSTDHQTTTQRMLLQ